MTDLLEKLAEWEVPPPPAQFDAQLHERVNRSLVVWQFVDLLLHGLPWAAAHFSQALMGLIIYTVTGRYPPDRRKQRR